MALIERLMRDVSEPRERWIPVHDFFAACGEVMQGVLTQNQVQTFLNMTAADIVDWNALVATFPTGSTATAIANKAMKIERMHGVFLLAERRYPGYDTPAAIRSKLGI